MEYLSSMPFPNKVYFSQNDLKVFGLLIEDDENTGYKTMFYERNLEKEASDEFYDSEDTSCIDFQGLVYEGDVIRSTDSFQETVTEVSFDGSFYTETEMTGLYVDGKTTRIK